MWSNNLTCSYCSYEKIWHFWIQKNKNNMWEVRDNFFYPIIGLLHTTRLPGVLDIFICLHCICKIKRRSSQIKWRQYNYSYLISERPMHYSRQAGLEVAGDLAQRVCESPPTDGTLLCAPHRHLAPFFFFLIFSYKSENCTKLTFTSIGIVEIQENLYFIFRHSIFRN